MKTENYSDAARSVPTAHRSPLIRLPLIRLPFRESVGEVEELVFDSVEPVGPVVGAGTGVEFVGNLFLEEFLVHVAVYLVEEVLGAAIEDDVHGAGLEQMGEVDDGVLVPKLGVLLVGAQTA